MSVEDSISYLEYVAFQNITFPQMAGLRQAFYSSQGQFNIMPKSRGAQR